MRAAWRCPVRSKRPDDPIDFRVPSDDVTSHRARTRAGVPVEVREDLRLEVGPGRDRELRVYGQATEAWLVRIVVEADEGLPRRH